MSLWMKKEVFKEDVMIVDCGYVAQQVARNRADRLIAFGISRKNISIELSNRILINIPKTKRAKVLEAFPIVEGNVYFGTTHHWEDGYKASGEVL